MAHMKVYVISSGMLYEGGSVNNVFVNKEKAQEYFQQLVEDKRASNKEMYEWEMKEDSEYTRENADRWLEEEHTIHENGDEEYVFYGSNFIELRSWITDGY